MQDDQKRLVREKGARNEKPGGQRQMEPERSLWIADEGGKRLRSGTLCFLRSK